MTDVKYGAILEGFALFSRLFGKWDQEKASKQSFLSGQLDHCVLVGRECQSALAEAGLPLSANYAAKIVSEFQNATVSGNDRVLEGMVLQRAYEYLGRFVRTLPDEADTRVFLAVSPENVRFYKQREPIMGDSVIAVFPDAAYDISEAGKCLSLGSRLITSS